MGDIEDKIFLCKDFIDNCDVKYPYFSHWQLCGKSYIEMDRSITCKNYEMIKKILEKENVTHNRIRIK